jgi:hypothetical protein
MLQSHRPVAHSTAGSLSRRELSIWVVSILAAHYALTFSVPAHASFFDVLVQSLASRSVFHYLGWFAVFRLLADSSMSRPATGADFALGLAASLIPFLPGSGHFWLSITLAGIYLYHTGRGDLHVRAAATVLLALSLNGFWGRLFFDLFAPFLLWVDTALVAAFLSVVRSGVTWNNTIIASGDHSIVVLSGCSSFHNISLGLLAWVALTKLARPDWVRADARVAIAVCAAVLLLNLLRIYLLALGAESYAYWHTGTGEQIFVWVTSTIVVAIALLGVLRTPSRR